ncbi:MULTISPECIES: ATP-binding protein [unclassified Microcoleus]|uniref:ATP-binding protein n=1 Tax=unclassified Microcoleus TaxID=2642155 RepID=UPI002FCEC08E
MKIRYLPYLAAFLTATLVLAIAELFIRLENEHCQQENRVAVLDQLSTVRAKLEGSLNQRLFVMQGLVAYISVSNPNISQAEFENLTRVILAKQPGIPSAALFKNSIATHLYPLAGKEGALGFAPLKIPEEKKPFQRAIDTRNTVVSGPVKLIEQGNMALITRTPIFLTPVGKPPESGRYWGMVSIGIDWNILLKEAGLLDSSAKLKYAIRGKDGLGAGGEVFFGDAKVFQRSPVTLEVTLPNGSWQLAAIPKDGWIENSPIFKWLWIAASFSAILAGGAIFVLVSTPAKLRERALQLESLLEELRRTQTMMIQAEKMSSLGQMVAGVAHEINNPVNFIHGNISYSSEYVADLIRLLDLYQKYYPEPAKEIKLEADNIELEFLVKDLPKTINSMKVGTERIQQIVLSLRNFSRLDESDRKKVNLHEGIDSTLLILQNRLKANSHHSEIRIVKEYGDLPAIECYAGQLNQAFMNLINNAIDTLEEKLSLPNSKDIYFIPTIQIATKIEGNMVEIRISDNGSGMKEEVRRKIFDPFYTTKQVGKGTGIGLSITYQIIVERHGGKIECVSEPGKGTEFAIAIPLTRAC